MSLNGVEKTFTEPNLAGMLDMRKGPLYQMLGQVTQQQLAQPRTNASTPPIWQGRSHKGDPVSILSRNPDGTFQTLIQGQEKTRTERDIAQMLNLRKGPLHEMLGQATKNMGLTPPNLQTDLDGGSQPTSKPKKRFGAKMEDTSTSDGHLNPGLPSHQSPKNMADAQAALSPLVRKSDEYARRWEAVQSRLDQVRDYVAANPGTPSKPPFLQTATERAEKTRLPGDHDGGSCSGIKEAVFTFDFSKHLVGELVLACII